MWDRDCSSPAHVVLGSLQFLYDWMKVHGNGSESMPQNSRSLACNIWHPPLAHYLKYNVDSAFFTDLKMVGFGM